MLYVNYLDIINIMYIITCNILDKSAFYIIYIINNLSVSYFMINKFFIELIIA